MATQRISIPTLAAEELVRAGAAHSGRSSGPVFGANDRAMHQVLFALKKGASQREHDNPGEVTIYVVHGNIQLTSEGEVTSALPGDVLVVPAAPYSVEALEDSAFLATILREQSIVHH